VRFRGERFATIPANVGLPRTNITGLLDDGRGHLWIGSEGGVWRVPRADLDRCADRGCSGVGALVFGKPEGMRTPECTGAFHPNMALDGQGRVWVATLRGLSVFPPPERVPRAIATPVIEQVALDGVPAALADVVRVGWRQRELVVRYTTASFLEGARPQLKHRLGGFDADWVLAGEQPVAHYHDLAAGTYTLEIRAGDDERSARRLTVVAEPPFWRTPTFFALLVLAGAAVGLGLHRMRMGRLQLRHRAVNAERARLARDLHDGLAQKLRAIGLLSDRLRLGRDEGEQAGGSERRLTPRLLELRQIVGEAYSELNRALWDLRAPTGTQRLETLIERTLSDVGVPSEVSVTLQTAADSLPVSGLWAHEVPLVVKEALVNAVRHARARNIEVGVLSDEDGLQVWVRDDGQGMPAERQAKAEGGYGIVGMHERARRLGGTLTIASEPGAGTEVALVVPRATQRGGRP
jgi:signal transduction histidine kinase